MRYITVPENIKLVDPLTRAPLDPEVVWSFHRFLVSVVLPDPRIGKGFQADLARFTVEALSREAEVGKVLEIESDHWEKLKTAVENPGTEFEPRIRMQLLPFQRAIVEAPAKDPSKKKAK